MHNKSCKNTFFLFFIKPNNKYYNKLIDDKHALER